MPVVDTLTPPSSAPACGAVPSVRKVICSLFLSLFTAVAVAATVSVVV